MLQLRAWLIAALIVTGLAVVLRGPARASGTSNFTIQVLALCGNGIKESGEQCDGSDFGGATCAAQGFIEGTLTCSRACRSDTSSCISGNRSGGGGGGGGGGASLPSATVAAPVVPPVPTASVVLEGRAYPGSAVRILKDAQEAVTTRADAQANFSVTLSGLSGGSYTFSVSGEDASGGRSSPFVFPLSMTAGSTTRIGGIFLAPTIAVNKREVKRGDTVTIFGQSIAGGEVTISVNSHEERFHRVRADGAGAYLLNLDTSAIEIGQHFTKSKVALNGEISPYGRAASFQVGDNTVFAVPKTEAQGDVSGDQRVNLVDFSIAAYWYKRPDPPRAMDLNNDKKVNLVDFSIMAYHWTG